MTAYAVFEPPVRKRKSASAPTDRFVFVRDAFTWGAFLLGPVWMVWRRLWLSLLAYIILLAVLEVAFRVLGVPMGARLGVASLLALLLGLEGASLRRWTLTRRGWRERGTVVADDLESAERRFFDVFVAARPAASPVVSPATPASESEPSPVAPTGSRLPSAANLPAPNAAQLPSAYSPDAAPSGPNP